ncbi:amino acid permease [Micrococcus sp.]|uniref:amino acid permease n=1 Tax=Micrococcus sp. TaxID=1271 RepID=UPI002A915C5D|nr:amino acid permease [Micrococcus sp.]MDY6055059.1 amino acid permease [Micrococcus sp.]
MTASPASAPGRPAPHDGAPGLRRALKNRHIQMIALGGAIGTGLFFGSAEAISLAGPAILLAYPIGGLVIYLVMRALGEMSVEDPHAGAFSHYAYRHWGRRAGFVSGWNYWFNYVAVSMVELAVVGAFVNYWLPGVPPWVSAAVVLVLITAVNLTGVRVFGEVEFWGALVKVAAVLGMIVLGIVVIAAGIPGQDGLIPSVTHLWDHGGFLPQGLMAQTPDGAWVGLLMALVVVMFSFGGVELIGMTAGEAEDPQRSIPRAVNQVVVRVLLFYVLALGVILCVIPWDRITGETSPFVEIFDSVGISVAAHLLNLVCLTAVVSVYNSGLYANGRMLYALAHQGNAPAFLGRVNRRGVPVNGVLASSAVTVVAVVVVFLWPEFAFQYLMSIALIAGIINWTMVMLTERRFRRALTPQARRGLRFPLPGGDVATWAVVVFLSAVVVLMLFSPAYRVAVFLGPVWLGILLVASTAAGRRARSAASAAPATPTPTR